MNLEFANRLAALRREHGLSQEELAEKLDVSRQSVSKWERGEAAPDTENLLKLADLYGVSLDMLLRGQKAHKATEKKHEAEVHVSWRDGVHVVDKGEEVHVSWRDGVHVTTPNESVRIPPNEIATHPAAKATLPFFSLSLLCYLCLGFLLDAWHPGWLIFFLIPLGHGLVSAVRARRFCFFPYPVLLLAIYLLLGCVYGLWHPYWALVFTIPLYYALAAHIDRRRHPTGRS